VPLSERVGTGHLGVESSALQDVQVTFVNIPRREAGLLLPLDGIGAIGVEDQDLTVVEVADIASAVIVEVSLLWVVVSGAVVTGVADLIAVRVGLGRIRVEGAVVAGIAESVAIGIAVRAGAYWIADQRFVAGSYMLPPSEP
jgi:hypothetical protein